MLKRLKVFTLACATLAGSAGCGGDAADKAPMPVEETVYGGQFGQMQRAREQTSKLSGERKETLDRQIDGQDEDQRP